MLMTRKTERRNKTSFIMVRIIDNIELRVLRFTFKFLKERERVCVCSVCKSVAKNGILLSTWGWVE